MSQDKIEAIYPLSPMQAGMLFHSIATTGEDVTNGEDVYFYQMSFTIHGPLVGVAFARAWQQVVERHPALRTLFVWEGREQPLQVVRRGVTLPVTTLDWRDRPAADQTAALADLRRQDRQRGFDLKQAPLMRLTLVELTDAVTELIWSYHSLLLDGWSLPIILQEALALYEADLRGAAITLPPPPPFRDYIRWLGEQDIAAAERFWRAELAGFTAPTPLNVDKTNRSKNGGATAYVEATLPGDLDQALVAFARGQHLTLNTLIQGAWALLLRRYSGADEVLFGVTGAGRPADLPGVENMVGVFINTIPLRVPVAADQPLRPWLAALQARHAAARQYDYAPLADIQRWSDVPGGTATFDSLLVFSNYPMEEVSLQGAFGQSVQLTNFQSFENTNYPLTLAVLPGEQMLLRIYYQPARFTAAAAARMLGHLQTLLAGMIDRPAATLADLPLLAPAERQTLLGDWSGTAIDYPQAATIAALFAEQAAARPETIALRFGQQTFTYDALNRKANELAHELIALGVGPDVPVAILAERSAAAIIAMLAVLKAGGAYVPLDPETPPQRLAYQMAEAAPRVVLSQAHLRFDLPAGSILVSLDEDRPAGVTTNPAPRGSAANLAYIMYTSGSTGRPKGIAIPQRAVIRLVKNNYFMRLGPGERFLQFAPITFDAATLEIWGSLLNGGELVVFPQHRPSLEDLGQVLRDYEISALWLTAGLFHQMVDNHLPALAGVRQLLAGGDVLSPAHAQRLLAELPGTTLIDGYGPTENTTFSTCCPLTAPEQAAGIVPIGRPIANTEVYLLDRQLRPVPAGVPGYLYVGGAGLARGYWHQPGLSAAQFIPHPFAVTPGERLYNTGDLARFRDDGVIEFLGREDFQVKIRGFRIELGEIELTLSGHPAVRDNIVLARGDTAGDKQLVAYVIPHPGQTPASDELRRFLGRALPDYMVPNAFVFLDAFPLTASGKADRLALPAPDSQRPRLATTFARPGSELERQIAAIWQKVLQIDEVGRDDNFFDLGGQSLLMLQVFGQLKKQFDADLTMVEMFQHTTVAALAERLGQQAASVATPAAAVATRAQMRRTATRRRGGQ